MVPKMLPLAPRPVHPQGTGGSACARSASTAHASVAHKTPALDDTPAAKERSLAEKATVAEEPSTSKGAADIQVPSASNEPPIAEDTIVQDEANASINNELRGIDKPRLTYTSVDMIYALVNRPLLRFPGDGAAGSPFSIELIWAWAKKEIEKGTHHASFQKNWLAAFRKSPMFPTMNPKDYRLVWTRADPEDGQGEVDEDDDMAMVVQLYDNWMKFLEWEDDEGVEIQNIVFKGCPICHNAI